jgi:ferredoxin--NADP+ reductase
VLRVAVVGSGPSGCYTAQSLVQLGQEVHVDVLDRLPCPYGLVRYGVAPDHEKIKSLQNALRTVLEHERVRFLGAVPVGPGGVPSTRLRELYHAVVYCVGAAADRRLGIPGEDLPGSWSATEFVSWYSAHPDAVDDGFLRGARSAVVIGVGNVAVDVARMLVRGPAELSGTDIPQAALDTLAAGRFHHQGTARTGRPAGHRRPGGAGRTGAGPGVPGPVGAARCAAAQRGGVARLGRAGGAGSRPPAPGALLPASGGADGGR